MAAEADASTSADRDVSGPEVRTPRRPVGEILQDLERERRRLVEAVDQLKAEASATRAKLLSPRSFAIAGGAVVALLALVALRRWRKRH